MGASEAILRQGFIGLGREIPIGEEQQLDGLHYASCVFEGERAYEGKVFKSHEHSERLHRSAGILGFKIPYSAEEIDRAKDQLIAKMGFKNCYVRAVAWRGSEMMGVSAQQ